VIEAENRRHTIADDTNAILVWVDDRIINVDIFGELLISYTSTKYSTSKSQVHRKSSL